MKPPIEVLSIFKKILKRITPDEVEIEHIEKVTALITKFIKNSQIPGEISIKFIEPQGSTGLKQTALKNTADIDLFIGIDPEIILNHHFSSKKEKKEFIHSKFKDLTKYWLIPCLKDHGLNNVKMSYAEHPYVSADFKGIELDIVICFDVSRDYLQKNGPITAVDRTPHHTRFIRDNINEKQKDDIRLLKHFFKCYNCYGDKSALGRSGFIGYSAELLIFNYDSIWNLFLNFEEISSKIIYNTIIFNSIINPYKNKSYQTMKSKIFPNDYLIILDPTDINRNVGSSISNRAFKYINNQIQNFCVKPNIIYFNYHDLPSIKQLNLSDKQLSCYFFTQFQEIQEDHYTKYRDKLYSLMEQIIRKASKEKTLESRFINVIGELVFNTETGQYILAFSTDTPKISSKFKREGPKKKSISHFLKFKDKHPDAFEENDQIFLILNRPFTQFKEFLIYNLNQKSIKGLELIKIGSANDPEYPLLAAQGMGNLHENVIPFI
jgi:tRNA CCA-adding enzyme